MAELNLSARQIYDQKFDVEFKGYSAEEVDKFLDMVIVDYQSFERELSELKNKVTSLEQKNATLKTYIIELEGKCNSLKEQAPVSSSDILKRLSRLEELVGNKEQ